MYNVSNSVLTYYPNLLKSLDVLIMSGDTDATVSSLGTQLWLAALGLQQNSPWHPMVDEKNNIVGYLQKFQKLSFASIRGAGHMVSADKPAVSEQLFLDFINGVI